MAKNRSANGASGREASEAEGAELVLRTFTEKGVELTRRISFSKKGRERLEKESLLMDEDVPAHERDRSVGEALARTAESVGTEFGFTTADWTNADVAMSFWRARVRVDRVRVTATMRPEHGKRDDEKLAQALTSMAGRLRRLSKRLDAGAVFDKGRDELPLGAVLAVLTRDGWSGARLSRENAERLLTKGPLGSVMRPWGVYGILPMLGVIQKELGWTGSRGWTASPRYGKGEQGPWIPPKNVMFPLITIEARERDSEAAKRVLGILGGENFFLVQENERDPWGREDLERRWTDELRMDAARKEERSLLEATKEAPRTARIRI